MKVMVGAALAAAAAISCGGIDGALVNLATRDKSTELPKAADNVVFGRLDGAPVGTAITVWSSDGRQVEGAEARCATTNPDGTVVLGSGTCADGTFEVHFAGNTDFSGLKLDARWSNGQAVALVPVLHKQCKVTDSPRSLVLGNLLPALGDLSPTSTMFTLAIQAKALDSGRGLSSFSTAGLAEMVSELASALSAGNPAVVDFQATVGRLLQSAGTDGKFPFPGDLPQGAKVRDLVDAASATAAGVTADDFATKALAAAKVITATTCYATDRIKVVFQVRLLQGTKDRNCAAINPFKWAKDSADKHMYLAAGVHETTPVCGGDGAAPPPYCVDAAAIDKANSEVLKNWVPNVVEMYDDGTNGDAVKGDHIYTVAMELPYVQIPVGADGRPTGAGFRVGYKYTWGVSGDNWTGTEEWPGNQRILELADLNGDGIVVRLDDFADETANKDKANQLSPANGGCGTNHWENDLVQGCGHDTRERKVDTDGDCILDAWPSAGSVAPLIVPCPGEAADDSGCG